MRAFTIPDVDVEFLQHNSSQAVCEDAYYLYLKAVSGILLPTPCPSAGGVLPSSTSEISGKKVLDLGTGAGFPGNSPS